jgi:cation diffusion facilitator family transporter
MDNSGKWDRKSRVAMLSVISNSALIALKLIAGLLSGSVSIISEAIHSSMDLAASVIAFFSVRVSSKPADKNHPYGHGKIENVSGVIEGSLIFIAAFLIVKEAVMNFFTPKPLVHAEIAIVVMLISALVNVIVSRKLYKVAKEEDSVALEADALHLKTDVYTSLGVALGLIIIKITGLAVLDSVVAIIVALVIVKEAWELCGNAFSPLLDASLSEEDENIIHEVIGSFHGKISNYHNLRTRKAGHIRYIEFHITVPGSQTVDESHGISEEVKSDIEKAIPNSNVSIHVDPIKK